MAPALTAQLRAGRFALAVRQHREDVARCLLCQQHDPVLLKAARVAPQIHLVVVAHLALIRTNATGASTATVRQLLLVVNDDGFGRPALDQAFRAAVRVPADGTVAGIVRSTTTTGCAVSAGHDCARTRVHQQRSLGARRPLRSGVGPRSLVRGVIQPAIVWIPIFTALEKERERENENKTGISAL